MIVYVLLRHHFIDNATRVVSVTSEPPQETRSSFHYDEIIEKVLQGDPHGVNVK